MCVPNVEYSVVYESVCVYYILFFFFFYVVFISFAVHVFFMAFAGLFRVFYLK